MACFKPIFVIYMFYIMYYILCWFACYLHTFYWYNLRVFHNRATYPTKLQMTGFVICLLYFMTIVDKTHTTRLKKNSRKHHTDCNTYIWWVVKLQWMGPFMARKYNKIGIYFIKSHEQEKLWRLLSSWKRKYFDTLLDLKFLKIIYGAKSGQFSNVWLLTYLVLSVKFYNTSSSEI